MNSWSQTLSSLLIDNQSSGPISRYVSLATTSKDNWPHVRTVVYRGMLGQSKNLKVSGELASLLILSTDNRSAKMEEVLHSNQSEMNWYFNTTRDQMRLKGYIYLIPSPKYTKFKECMDQIPAWIKQVPLESERQHVWDTMSSGLRASFTWEQPGSLRNPTESFTGVTTLDSSNAEAYQVGLDNFVLVLFQPILVDLVRLGTNPPFSRIQWTASEQEWTRQVVWP
jgi:hypothetical protein